MADDTKFNEKVVPYLPVYARPPNKLLRYEERPFFGGTCRFAIFTDKNGKEQEMTAQVLWKENKMSDKDVEIVLSGFKTKAQAEEFLSWLCESGEQYLADWLEIQKSQGKNVPSFIGVKGMHEVIEEDESIILVQELTINEED